MGMKSKPRLKEYGKETAKLNGEATPEGGEEKKIIVKKWKGKDWFSILAPAELGAKMLGQTPTTDPKTIMGRNIAIGVSDLVGDRSKYYMKINLRINKIEGKTALTVFNGFECIRERLMRMVRKRNQKVEGVFDVMTKDSWFLRVKPVTILNGNTTAAVQNKMRIFMREFLNDFSKNNKMSDILKKIISTELQMRIKREGSKIYPVRFSEIARIKVLKSPEIKYVAATKPAEKKEEKPDKEVKEAKPAEKKENPTKEKKETNKKTEEKK